MLRMTDLVIDVSLISYFAGDNLSPAFLFFKRAFVTFSIMVLGDIQIVLIFFDKTCKCVTTVLTNDTLRQYNITISYDICCMHQNGKSKLINILKSNFSDQCNTNERTANNASTFDYTNDTM